VAHQRVLSQTAHPHPNPVVRQQSQSPEHQRSDLRYNERDQSVHALDQMSPEPYDHQVGAVQNARQWRQLFPAVLTCDQAHIRHKPCHQGLGQQYGLHPQPIAPNYAVSLGDPTSAHSWPELSKQAYPWPTIRSRPNHSPTHSPSLPSNPHWQGQQQSNQRCATVECGPCPIQPLDQINPDTLAHLQEQTPTAASQIQMRPVSQQGSPTHRVHAYVGSDPAIYTQQSRLK